jgi:nicotinate-nucleotide pyrophosphorylase (carboxylating)
VSAPAWLRKVVAIALEEDLGSGDVTSELCVLPRADARGEIVAKASGILAGMAAAREVACQVDEALAFTARLSDGDALSAGVIVAEVVGLARSVLAMERTALNFLQQLSGVATLTRAYVDRVRGTKARIVDTRKTVPGMRMLQKQAVLAGGGANHRLGLYDAVLIKDNHIALAGGVREALQAARARAPHVMKVEIEVTSPDDAEVAAELGADVIMLDNMDLEQVRESLRRIGGRSLTEVSGRVTLDNVADYAALGVDVISVGRLTHSAPAVDMSLEVRS